jgi:hypothetical protein
MKIENAVAAQGTGKSEITDGNLVVVFYFFSD